MFRDEGPDLIIMALHKKHNVEDVRLKARPVGRSPKARLCVIAFHHAISMLSQVCLFMECLDSGFWVAPEFMIISQSCLKVNRGPLNLSAWWCCSIQAEKKHLI